MKNNCKVILTEDAIKDLMSLSDELLDEYLVMHKKLENNIHLGKPLTDKNGKDLSGCYKIYFNEAKHRIVYCKKNDKYEILGIGETSEHIAEIIAIGKRDKEKVYQDAADRLKKV